MATVTQTMVTVPAQQMVTDIKSKNELMAKTTTSESENAAAAMQQCSKMTGTARVHSKNI